MRRALLPIFCFIIASPFIEMTPSAQIQSPAPKPPDAVYLLKPAHILDGDVVILEDRKEVNDGDIVAALIDGETTLKRYVVNHGRPYLKAENPRFPDLVPARELRIQGVMVSLVRKQMPSGRRKRL